jgi:hypothetical protein
MPDDGEHPLRTQLAELTEVLEVAARLADTLGGEGTVGRVVEAFRLMPLEDREVIADIIEREVQARRLSLATEVATGQSMHPNPNARLYLRSHEKASLERNLLERHELMLAMLAGMRLTPLLLVPDIHDAWLEGTRGAIDHLDAAERQAAAKLLREVLALVEEAEAAATNATARAS